MAKAVTGRGLGDARRTDRRAEQPLDHRGVQVVAAQQAGLGVDVLPGSGEHPLPAELPGRAGVLPLEGVREGHRPAAGLQIPGVPDADLVEMLLEGITQRPRKDRLPVLSTLAVPDHEHPAAELDVLDAQGQAFVQPETAAVHEGRDQPEAAAKAAEHRADLLPRQDDRQAHGALGARGVGEAVQLPLEHCLEREQEGAEGLVLGGGADPPPDRQVGELGPDLGRAQDGKIAVAVEREESA